MSSLAADLAIYVEIFFFLLDIICRILTCFRGANIAVIITVMSVLPVCHINYTVVIPYAFVYLEIYLEIFKCVYVCVWCVYLQGMETMACIVA